MKSKGVLLSNQSELENCTFVKTVLMISIVFYHSIVFWRGGWSVVSATPSEKPVGLYWLVQWLACFQNYAFVFTSGYLFYYIKYERGGYSRFGSFLKNKAERLLVPFVFVGLVWIIPISCLYMNRNLWQTAIDYLLVRDAGQLWFLVMLFGVFMLAWPLSNFFAKHFWGGLAVVLAIYAFRIVGARFIPDCFSIWNVAKYLIVFWLGFKLRQNALAFLRKIPLIAYLIIYTVLMVCYVHITLPHDIFNKLFNLGVEFLVHGVGAIMAFLLLQKIAEYVHWKKNKVFAFFSSGSMVIFLFHQQIIYFFINHLNGLLNPYIHAMVNFAGSLLLSSVVAAVLMKFRITRRLVGAK